MVNILDTRRDAAPPTPTLTILGNENTEPTRTIEDASSAIMQAGRTMEPLLRIERLVNELQAEIERDGGDPAFGLRVQTVAERLLTIASRCMSRH